jgi:hypothetical protein
MLRYGLIAVFVFAFTDLALASYWIVRGSDNKCIVVDMEPTDKTITKVGRMFTSPGKKPKPTSRSSARTERGV